MNRKKVFLLAVLVIAIIGSGVETWLLVDQYDSGGEVVIREITPKPDRTEYLKTLIEIRQNGGGIDEMREYAEWYNGQN